MTGEFFEAFALLTVLAKLAVIFLMLVGASAVVSMWTHPVRYPAPGVE